MLKFCFLLFLLQIVYADDSPEFLKEAFPAQSYHESSVSEKQLDNDSSAKPVQKTSPTVSPLFSVKKSWLEKTIAYSFSYDYINSSQHFDLMRNAFDSEGWNEYNLVIRDVLHDVDLQQTISRASVVNKMELVNEEKLDQTISSMNIKVPVQIVFYSDNHHLDKMLDVSVRCNEMTHCWIHGLSLIQ